MKAWAVIFVGDQRQHYAIEAGRPIYQMQEAGMLVTRLDTIRRQRDPELREAVTHAARGESRVACDPRATRRYTRSRGYRTETQADRQRICRRV